MFQLQHHLLSLLALLLLITLSSAVRRLPGELLLKGHFDFSSANHNASALHHPHQSNRNLTKQRHRRVSVPIPESPDGHLVKDLPLLDNAKFPTSHWAGLLPASDDDGDKYLFYWLFAPDDGSGKDMDFSDTSIPLIIWLNGGPACSSMDGLWLENGPFRITQDSSTKDWSIEVDEHSWHKSPAFVIYIDQPVGTGISFTTSRTYPKNDVEVNTDFYYFLQKFLSLHKDKFLDSTNTLNRPLYFSGESHAGHYIPSMMNYIQKQNAAKSSSIQIPLAGAAIGNGWIDPPVQYSAHEAAYGKGIIGLAQRRAMQEKEKECQKDLASGKYVSTVCFSLLDKIVDNSLGKGSGYKISQYDARKTEKVGTARDFPKGHKDVEAYLGGLGSQSFASNFQNVLTAIHSLPSYQAGQQFEECTDPPYNALKHQDGLGVTQDVSDLLNSNVRMLFFNGIEDMICNHVGNEIAVENFKWKSQNEYQMAGRYSWKAPSTNTIAGYMKEYDNLMYLKIKDSGHMVPMDVPNVALDMIRSLVYKKSFEDFEQRIDRQATGDRSDSNGGNCPICPTNDNKECPTCPECPSDDGSNSSDGSNNPEDWEEWAEKSPAVLVGVGVVTTWLVTLCTYWICAKRNNRGAPMRPYDMEMTGGRMGYSDELDFDNEEEEDGDDVEEILQVT